LSPNVFGSGNRPFRNCESGRERQRRRERDQRVEKRAWLTPSLIVATRVLDGRMDHFISPDMAREGADSPSAHSVENYDIVGWNK
jgi:hypothetical protein